MQLQPALFRRVKLMRQRLIKPLVERAGIGVGVKQERVGRIEIPAEAQPVRAVRCLAGEDDFPFDLLAVSVRPADESAGALVGTPATRPRR